ncbi:hypothetical protein ANN_14669 [Periplaneta americana]|uniref:Uncharacterized protein n=1 Tax=Periplaneta americana TaxID=6978 RepID=A0ABQ8SYI9_PERAM|nr:hypothetical protein ANN_14669 [Periplaneta americana]
MWLADEPREFNLPTLPQRCIACEAEKLPSKYGVHSEDLSSHTMTERPLSNAQLVSIVNSSDSEEFVSEFVDNEESRRLCRLLFDDKAGEDRQRDAMTLNLCKLKRSHPFTLRHV